MSVHWGSGNVIIHHRKFVASINLLCNTCPKRSGEVARTHSLQLKSCCLTKPTKPYEITSYEIFWVPCNSSIWPGHNYRDTRKDRCKQMFIPNLVKISSKLTGNQKCNGVWNLFAPPLNHAGISATDWTKGCCGAKKEEGGGGKRGGKNLISCVTSLPPLPTWSSTQILRPTDRSESGWAGNKHGGRWEPWK